MGPNCEDLGRPKDVTVGLMDLNFEDLFSPSWVYKMGVRRYMLMVPRVY